MAPAIAKTSSTAFCAPEKTDWESYTDAEKTLTENTALLVGLLFKMCKVQLVLVSEDASTVNQVNHAEVEKTIRDANELLENTGLAALA